MGITYEELLRETEAGLDERLRVETPHRYGEGIIVDAGDDGQILVVQPNGPAFVVTVAWAALEVAS